MSVSLYQSGVSGLLAAQQQLATTGHNISNVNTDGYTRQRAEQNAAIGLNNGSNYIGGGTYIQDITRVYDEFAQKEQLINQSKLGNADSLQAHLSQLDQVMATSGGSVVSSLEQFYQAINGVADSPNDSGLRSIVLSQANTLSSDLNQLSDNFDQMTKSVNGEIEQVVNRISEISVEIAKINESIMHSQSESVGQPNDLLDARDNLINELGEYTQVNTIEDANGVMTVMVGQGTTLVAGITPLTLEVSAGDPDATKTEISLISGSNRMSMNTASLGGSLGASLEFRDEHLAQARDDIDRLAMAISVTLNESQASGLDLNGLQGKNIFTDINATEMQQGRVLAHSNNSTTVDAAVEITDISKVPTDELEIRYDGTDFTLYNLTTGDSENLGAPSGASTSHTPTSPDYGFSFVVDNGSSLSAGDTFAIVPTKNGAALMETTLTDGNAIAASSAVGVTPSTNNISDGSITVSNVTDPETAKNSNISVEVHESSTGVFTYNVYDDTATLITTGSYLSGETESVDLTAGYGFSIEISGDLVGQGANAPESFNIAGAFGVGNSNNALAMALTQETGITNGGKETFSQSIATTTSVVGSSASNADLTAETAQALFTQAYNRNQATAGVNLDEEAANLLQYQQAYQAASQIISTANTLFDTILSAVR